MTDIQQQPVKRKAYINELDVLRALAFLAVVFQHTLGVYIRSSDIQLHSATMLGMLFNLVKFAVPAFVFLTGMTLLYNYYEKLQYGTFLIKRTKEIIVPYVLWTLIYELVLNGVPHLSVAWVVGMVKNLIVGREYYHLWFVPMIFQFYVFYPILRYLTQWVRKWTNCPWKFWLFVLVVTAAYAWLMWFTVSYIGGGHLKTTTWLGKSLIRFLSQNSLFWIFYFVLGAIAGLSLTKWREFVNRSITWNSFLFVLLFVWVGYELMRSVTNTGHIDLNFSTSLKPSMFFYTVSEIVLVYGLSIMIARENSWAYRMFSFIGKYSYGAYLAHAWVLTYAIRITGKFFRNEGHIAKMLICWFICSVLTIALVYLISKIPYANWLIGSTNKKAAKQKPTASVTAPSTSA